MEPVCRIRKRYIYRSRTQRRTQRRGRHNRGSTRASRRQRYRRLYKGKHSGWSVRVFGSSTALSSVPSSTRGMKYIGGKRMHSLKFTSPSAFRAKFPRLPSSNYVWVVGGTLVVHRKGDYKYVVPLSNLMPDLAFTFCLALLRQSLPH